MSRYRSAVVLAVFVTLCQTSLLARGQESGFPPIVGRWDVTVTSEGGTFPSWFEIEPSGFRTLVGRFVGRFGSARPVSQIRYDAGKLSFSLPPQWEQGDKDLVVEGEMKGDGLVGWMTDANGTKYTWTAVRAPALPAPSNPKWGKSIALIGDSDLKGWVPRDAQANKWQVRDKVLANTARGCDIETAAKFKDFKLHAEIRYPKGSNSGIYLRGRYEVQITDDDNRGLRKNGLGGVYGFLAPSFPPATKPGEWHSLDITLLGRIVTVSLDGKTLISEQEIPGITGGALDSDEGAPGPLLLQGDHGPVEFRSMILTPAVP